MTLRLAQALLLVLGCRAAPRLDDAASQLRVSDTRLEFGRRFVGSATTQTVTLFNEGRRRAALRITAEPPFRAGLSSATLEGGSELELGVAFEPTEPGLASGALLVEAGDEPRANVQLSGEALAQPSCEPQTSCQRAQFEPASGRCLVETVPDDTPCSSGCISRGACVSGICRGSMTDRCDDRDACTIDGCANDGTCVSVPVTCPVEDPCLTAACDPALGCRAEPLPDGTSCGETTCRTARICISGACVTRNRPDQRECVARDLQAYNDTFCALTEAGTIRCWGNSLEPPYSPPTTYRFRKAATGMGLGEVTRRAVFTDGTLEDAFRGPFDAGSGRRVQDITGEACWRFSTNEVACTFPASPEGRFLQLTSAPNSSSFGHFCAIREDGGGVCWDSVSSWHPPSSRPIRRMMMSRDRLVTVDDRGAQFFRLGSQSPAPHVACEDLLEVQGWNNPVTLGLRADGGLVTFGAEPDGGTSCAGAPDDAGLGALTRLVSARSTTCVLTRAGAIACQGSNFGGLLGDLSLAPPGVTSTGVDGVRRFHLSATGARAAALLGDGGVIWWGEGSPIPRVARTGVDAIDVRAVGGGVCPLGRDGRLQCDLDGRPSPLALARAQRLLEVQLLDRYSPSRRWIVWFADERGVTCGAELDGGVSCDRRYWPAQTTDTSCGLGADGGVQCERFEVTVDAFSSVAGTESLGTFCALGTHGRVWCWKTSGGALRVSPSVVQGLPFARDVACGAELLRCHGRERGLVLGPEWLERPREGRSFIRGARSRRDSGAD